jgi:hypothetical protein
MIWQDGQVTPLIAFSVFLSNRFIFGLLELLCCSVKIIDQRLPEQSPYNLAGAFSCKYCISLSIYLRTTGKKLYKDNKAIKFKKTFATLSITVVPLKKLRFTVVV